MPSFANISKKVVYDETSQLVIKYVRTNVLAENKTVLCITDIYPTKTPDDYGNYYWLIKCITGDIDSDRERVCFKLQMSTKRDKFMHVLQDILKESKGKPDSYIHGVIVDILENKNPKLRPAFILKASPQITALSKCLLCLQELDQESIEGDLGELDDHPF